MIHVRPATAVELAPLTTVLTRAWGGTVVVAHGQAFDAATLPARVAESGGDIAGVLTYQRDGDSVEIITLDAVAPNQGVGTALLDAARQIPGNG